MGTWQRGRAAEITWAKKRWWLAFAALGTMVDDAEEVDPEVATRLVAATLRLVDSATRVRYPRRRMWSCE